MQGCASLGSFFQATPTTIDRDSSPHSTERNENRFRKSEDLTFRE